MFKILDAIGTYEVKKIMCFLYYLLMIYQVFLPYTQHYPRVSVAPQQGTALLEVSS